MWQPVNRSFIHISFINDILLIIRGISLDKLCSIELTKPTIINLHLDVLIYFGDIRCVLLFYPSVFLAKDWNSVSTYKIPLFNYISVLCYVMRCAKQETFWFIKCGFVRLYENTSNVCFS